MNNLILMFQINQLFCKFKSKYTAYLNASKTPNFSQNSLLVLWWWSNYRIPCHLHNQN